MENRFRERNCHAKDTPNFIGNRIGVYGMMIAINLAQEYGLTVEEVDKLTGPISVVAKKARPSELLMLSVWIH